MSLRGIFLKTKGEGILNIVFNCDDTAKALSKAKSMGVQCLHSLDYTQEEIDAHLGALFSRYEEHVLNTSGDCGFSVTIAKITEKP